MSNDSKTLFDLTAELRALMADIIDAEGEVTDEQDKMHDALRDAASEKTEAYIVVLNELKEKANAQKALEKHYRAKRKATESAIDRMKDTLLWSMDELGDEVRDTDAGKVRVQKASRRGIEIHVDAENLPHGLQRVSVRADKRAIRDIMEERGVEFLHFDSDPVATMKPATRYVRIY